MAETERKRKIEALFHGALACDPAERAAFLEEACRGDTSLKAEVESLVAAIEGAPDFLKKPALARFAPFHERRQDAPAEEEPEKDLPFDRLGEYRLIRYLGEGGMGVVYLAEQESLGRKVALKMIRPERTGSLEVTRRFWREAEAISKVSHPSIITVFGTGEEKGVRYFAMELVPGKGMDEVLREAVARSERISISRILDWIEEIARGLDRAHQHGIIHRDVKPSNIRITPEGQAKLMDFGIARHLELSTMTLTGSFRGTPHYASPEQIRGRHQQIDPRTDVYSLGVTLYEALTGRVPFDGETTEQVFHQILQEDPVPPRRLNPSISRDLNTVAVTAMEKEASRRYQSMAEFAEDLKRLQSGEAISAKPAGYLDRAWKRIKRNPLLSAAVGAALLILVSFLGYVLFWSYPKIMEERDKAVKAQERAMEEAEKAKAINLYLKDMLSSPDPYRDGKEIRVFEVLDRAVKKMDTAFLEQPEVEAALRNTMGITYHSLGMYEPAHRQLTAALEINRRIYGEEDPATLTMMYDLAFVLLKKGELLEAESLQRKTIESQSRVEGEEAPNTLKSGSQLVEILLEKGEYPEAESLLHEVLEAQRRVLGEEHLDTIKTLQIQVSLLLAKGKPFDAEPLLRRVLEVRRRELGEEHLVFLSTMINLACVLNDQGKFNAAEPFLRETIEIQRRVLGDEHPTVLSSMNNLGNNLGDQGKYAEAESLLRNVLEISRRVLGAEHTETVRYVHNLAVVLDGLGRYSESEPLYREALKNRRSTLGGDHPLTMSATSNLANNLHLQGKYLEAEALYRESHEARHRILGEEHPHTLMSMLNLAQILKDQGKYPEAEALLLDALDKLRRTMGEEHVDTLRTMDTLAVVFKYQGRFAEAEELHRSVLETMRRVLGEEHRGTLTTMNNLAMLLGIQKRRGPESEELLRKVVAIQQRVLGEEHPDTLAAMNNLGAGLSRQGKYPEAEELYRKVLEAQRRRLGEEHLGTIIAMNNLGNALVAQRRYLEAEPLLEEAVDRISKVLPPENYNRAVIHSVYGLCLAQQKRYDEAEEHYLTCYEGFLSSVGAENQATRDALTFLTNLYHFWGKPDKAAKYRRLLNASLKAETKE